VATAEEDCLNIRAQSAHFFCEGPVPPGGVPSGGASERHQKDAPARLGAGASSADEIVVGFDRRDGVTKLRINDAS
jgi:hypothetical protein